MDFLEKALEKAKVSEKKETFASKSFVEEEIENEEGVKSIVYTQTRTVSHNLATLLERRIVAVQHHHPVSHVFRMLRTKILKRMRQNNWNSFAVTAPTQGAGKSMVSVNLAISIAMEANQTVLLVDMDLHYPKVNWYLDIDVEYGLGDYLSQEIPLQKLFINPSIERLVILPGHGHSKGGSELIASQKMRKLVHDIKTRYQSRIIIFDLPPILSSDEVLASMDYYDATLLVLAEGENTPEEVNKSLQMLSGTHLLGTVLNKSETTSEHQVYY